MAEIDREKVVKELTELNDEAYGNYVHSHGPFFVRVGRVCEDALTLIKEQEPVNPIRIVNDNNFIYDLCGFCGKTLPVSIDYDRARYCPLCGRPVKWDE